MPSGKIRKEKATVKSIKKMFAVLKPNITVCSLTKSIITWYICQATMLINKIRVLYIYLASNNSSEHLEKSNYN